MLLQFLQRQNCEVNVFLSLRQTRQRGRQPSFLSPQEQSQLSINGLAKASAGSNPTAAGFIQLSHGLPSSINSPHSSQGAKTIPLEKASPNGIVDATTSSGLKQCSQ